MRVFDISYLLTFDSISAFNSSYFSLSILILVLEAWAFAFVLSSYNSLDWSFVKTRLQSKLGATNASGSASYTAAPSASKLSFWFLINPSSIYTQLSTNLHLVKEAYYRANTARQNSIFQNLFETITWGLLRIPYYVYN